jgi:type IV pilus assembly protein PilW
MAGSDVVAIKRVFGKVAGTDTVTTGLLDGTIYLRTHDKYGRLYLQGGGTPAAVDTPYNNWQYSPVLYFVQKYSVSATESPQVPSLCRMVLKSTGGAAPAFTKECIAQGIENLQVEIGVDTDEDGGANYFTASPTDQDLNRACTARLYLLARGVRREVDYVNPKTYQIGNMASAYPPAGSDMHYHRKTLSTEVALRNPRALWGIAVQ